MNHTSILSFDMEWVPDFMLHDVLDLLEEHNVKSTWFVTHPTKVLDRMRQRPDLIELGIHPNFLPGSTQGETEDEIFNYCFNIVPEAISMRAHCLYHNTRLLAKMIQDNRIKICSNILLPFVKHQAPFNFYWYKKTIKQVPIFWEDDYTMEMPNYNFNDVSFFNSPGINVYNFHPHFIYLNACSTQLNNQLKQAFPNYSTIKKLMQINMCIMAMVFVQYLNIFYHF